MLEFYVIFERKKYFFSDFFLGGSKCPLSPRLLRLCENVNEQTNEPTNKQTPRIAIPASGGKML